MKSPKLWVGLTLLVVALFVIVQKFNQPAETPHISSDRVPASVAEEKITEPLPEVTPEEVSKITSAVTTPRATPKRRVAAITPQDTSRSAVFKPETDDHFADKPYDFAVDVGVAQRQYITDGVTQQAVDSNIGLRVATYLSEQLAIEARAEVAALSHTQTHGDEAPKPLKIELEVIYNLNPQNISGVQWSLAGGYQYQTTISGTAPLYLSRLYGFLFGFDLKQKFRNGSKLKFSPRATAFSTSSFTYELPMVYMWSRRRWLGVPVEPGVKVSYSAMHLEGVKPKKFDYSTLSAAFVLNY